MASDSDLEAYLNQLSKKTHKLQQDVQTKGYSASRPPSCEDKSDISNFFEVNISEKFDSKMKISQAVSTADITALSDKYGKGMSKKSQLHDELSNLENKYLKKSVKKVTRVVSPDVKFNKSGGKPSNGRESESYKPSFKVSKTERYDISNDTSVDDELARYLNERSLAEDQDLPKDQDDQEGSVAGSDNIFNLDNIMTVDDILGQLTDEDDTKSRESELNYVLRSPHIPEVPNKDNNIFTKNNSTVKAPLPPQRRKSIFEGETDSPFYSKKNVKTGESLLNSTTKNTFDKTEGLLFTQASENVFHSSRRNSIMSPIFKRKISSKSLLSESVHEIQDNDSNNSDEIRESDSIEENISLSNKCNLPGSVVESGTEFVPAEYSKDETESEVAKPQENITTKPKSNANPSLKGVKNVKSSRITDECKNKKDMLQKKQTLNVTRKVSVDPKNSTIHKHNKKEEEQLTESERSSEEETESNSDRKTHEKKKTSERSHRKSKRKRKKKSRQSSSSSSSTSSRTSSSSSESSYVRYKDSHSRYKRKSKKGQTFNPWHSNPYISPWWWMQSPHSFPPPAGTELPFHFPNPRHFEEFVPTSSIVGVKDIMRQQVALTRQFMESQKSLYHAYTATLTSSYHYTSLRDTEKYIKQKKHPLTFDEAYGMVKEEMNNSK